jgi:Mycobacterium membrane protein
MARYSALLPLSAAFAGLVVAAPAAADPALPWGPDTCIQGYVFRLARPGDLVCVVPAVRDRTAQENANPTQNRQPGGGAYGTDTCKQGFVWREAFDGDTICVTPEERAQTLADNAAAESRKQANQPTGPGNAPANNNQATVKFEITGSGTVYSIDIDPGGRAATENATVPWSTTVTVGPDIQLLQVVSVAKTGNQGCRISVNGKVVAENPPGDSHCTFARF